MHTTARVRLSRAEIEPAALDLIERHGAQIISTARRYSATAEDAEDAFQRGLEIDEEAERYERLRLGAEAMGRLKPQEIRALLLKAEGLTYKEIQEETGWTYTKV